MLRYRPGGIPQMRAKARLKAYSEVYPTDRAMAPTGYVVVRSCRAAKSIRHRVR
jgi:hypothetical protein